MNILKSKHSVEMSFALIFALIAGIFILAGAIYATIKLIGTGQEVSGTMVASQLTILFEPMETGLASGKRTEVIFNMESRIYNQCFEAGSFGSQRFSATQKSSRLKQWPAPGVEIELKSKYVFSYDVEQGTRAYFFSKPFNMPFKASELIFFSTKTFCFADAPDFIKEEVEGLEIKNVKFENCSSKEIKVCFNSNCEISVYGTCNGIECATQYDYGYVLKEGKKEYFVDSLIYGGIFASPGLYECNFKRLMKRIEQVAYLYSDESNFLAGKGCGERIGLNLISLAQSAKNANPNNEAGILTLIDDARIVDEQNSAQEGEGCRIW